MTFEEQPKSSQKIGRFELPGFTPDCQILAEGMFALSAIKFGDFRWTFHTDYLDAPLAPMYFEVRMVRRHPIIRNHPVDILERAISGLKFDLLADVPQAMTPTVYAVSERLAIGMVTPRKEPKGKGSGAMVDGFLPEDKGKTVLLIDDVLARGDSKLIPAEILKKEGAVVNDIVVLMDYEIGGRQILKEHGYRVHSVFNAKQLLGYLYFAEKIKYGIYQRTTQRFSEITKFFNKIDNAVN